MVWAVSINHSFRAHIAKRVAHFDGPLEYRRTHGGAPVHFFPLKCGAKNAHGQV